MLRIGLISDTHGLLRPEAAAFLEGSDYIIHAGDICDASIIKKLETIAPVTAVRGNNDKGSEANDLREMELLQIGSVWIYVIHDLSSLDASLIESKVRVVISGHSHKPHCSQRDGVLYINPGSAGPRRFKLPISAAELMIEDSSISARIHEFTV